MTRTEWILFGERLRHQRNSFHLTQEEVAEKLGIGFRYYQMLEQGYRNPSISVLIKISKVLSISTDYLLFGETAFPASPLGSAMEQLTPEQQKDALEMLALYIKACKSPR